VNGIPIDLKVVGSKRKKKKARTTNVNLSQATV
jgi:hypothetical protein